MSLPMTFPTRLRTVLVLPAVSLALVALVACGSRPKPLPPPPPTMSSAAATLPASVGALAKGAILFDDLGTHRRVISTASPEAQKYFDQGLRLAYGFNHDEATRSFARGAEIDPGCAMCLWGAAYTMGPNYNVPMLPDRAKAAWEALERAKSLTAKVTPVEAALIGALAKRYKGPEPVDPAAMEPFSAAYATAMKEVATTYPADDDVQVLTAEARMDVLPWKLWSLDGKPAADTEEIVDQLETVLDRNPTHPGANHYYIHAIEASTTPEKGLPAAERLAGLMPGAGHIVHMPAHIFQRVGRYADASAANEKAAAVDEAYLKKVKAPGYYPMYLGHNYGFLAFSASMEGRSATAIDAARRAAKAMPPGMIDMMPGMDFFVAEPILVLVRFGKWDELLAEPRPDPKYAVFTGLWLHGHGMALATKGKLEEARADHAALLEVAKAAPAGMTAGNSQAKDVFAVAAKVLEARIASHEPKRKKEEALALWAEAVALADGLAYSEPDDWFYSVRDLQGAALLAAHLPGKAEAVFRKDLARRPHSGWATIGLLRALAAQHKGGAEAKALAEDLAKVWANADVKPPSSAY